MKNGSPEGDLVGVLEVATDRQAARDAGDLHAERLEQARQSLLQAKPGDSVSSIAARFGFSSLSAFSRDFRAAFGIAPSDLLREGLEFRP